MLAANRIADGAFGETVFFHKPTKTLLVTDTVLEVTKDVPKIFEDDPKVSKV